MTTGHLFYCRIMPGKMDFLERTSSWHARNWPDVVSEKISPEQVKAMLHGNVRREMEESMEPSVLPTQQENIEKEAVDMQESLTALMTGYNEVHDIIPTI